MATRDRERGGVGAPGDRAASTGSGTATAGDTPTLTLATLLANRETFRSLAAALPRGVLLVCDHDLRFLFAGGPGLVDYGVDPAGFEGRTIADVLPGAPGEMLAAQYRAALAGQVVEFDYRANSGEVFRATGRPIRDESGTVLAALLVAENVTDARRQVTRLAESAEQLAHLQRLAGLGTFRYDVRSRTFELSDELRQIWGLPPEADAGDELDSRIHPDDRALARQSWRQLVSGAANSSIEYRILREAAEDVRHIRAVLEAERDAADGLVAIRGTHLDITDLIRAQQRLARSQAMSRAVMAASPDLTLLVDLSDTRIIWSSAGNRGVAHWSEGADSSDLGAAGQSDEAADRSEPTSATGHLLDLVHPDDAAELRSLQQRMRHAAEGRLLTSHFRAKVEGTGWRWYSIRATSFRRNAAGHSTEAVCVVRDVNDVILAEQRLHHAAHHDALTGLANRARLLQELGSRSDDDGTWGSALLYVDVDNFKRVNDQFGHHAGDAVLVALAHRLQTVVRAEDMVARVGGDEFVVLLGPTRGGTDVGGEEQERRRVAVTLAERLRAAAAEPILHDGREFVLSASVGIRLASPSLGAEDALRDADAAMYLAKRSGRDNSTLFNPRHRAEASQQARTEQLLRRCLTGQEGGLNVVYQPVFDLATRRLHSFEALARLTSPDGEAISPDDFIAVAEQTGLIRQLGDAVLARACQDLHGWLQAAPEADGVTVAVNLSARQAQQPGLAESVLTALQDHRLLPSDLTLEVTETSLLSAGLPALHELERLRAVGVGIAIDDFGVGYAPLRYLATLPVSSLKVDRSFTAGLPRDRVSATIVKAVAGLAAEMGLRCVVEGIETPGQLGALPAGVLGQGFLLGRPREAAGVLHLLSGVEVLPWPADTAAAEPEIGTLA